MKKINYLSYILTVLILTVSSINPSYSISLSSPTDLLKKPKEGKEGAMQVEGIEDVDLELVWDPPWNKEMMSEAAKLELNL